jgi:hypothetical protein
LTVTASAEWLEALQAHRELVTSETLATSVEAVAAPDSETPTVTVTAR